MREYNTWVQIKSGKQIKTQQLDSVSLVQNLYQTSFKAEPMCLIQDNAVVMKAVLQFARLFILTKIKPVQMFQKKTQNLSEISINFDPANFPENTPVFKDYKQLPQPFIRISKDIKFIDIRLIQASGKISPEYLRYTKNSPAYRYLGLVH